jgi:hypothetical protein
MYITPYQKKQLRTVIILLVGIPLTIFAGYQAIQWFTSAGAEAQPHNVIVGNLAQESAVITWTTETKVSGSVVLLENGVETTTAIDKRGNERRYTHYVEFEYLEPSTTYEFKIISGEGTYEGEGASGYTFTTPNVAVEQATPVAASGEVEGSSGDDVLVYVTTKDKSVYPAVTILNSSGTWLVDLSVMKKVSDKTVFQVSPSNSLVIAAVSGVNDGGIVEGEYGEIFNSDSILTESLNSTGTDYVSYFSNESRLIAQTDTPEPVDEEPYTPPAIGGPGDEVDEDVDDDIDREYELRMDLVWGNLVSADGGSAISPENYGEDTVQITNLTDTTFTVIWYSQNQETGHIMYGTSASNLSERGRDERDGIASQGQYYLHSIEVTQLEPETQYYFEVYSGDEVYSTQYDVTTYATQSTPPEFETLSGTVTAEYPESVVVTARFEDNDGVGSSGLSNTISTLPDSDGNWILTTGGARDGDGGYFDKSDEDTVYIQPLYLSNTTEIEMTFGEASSNDILLTIELNAGRKFVKVPLLDDYGILVD